MVRTRFLAAALLALPLAACEGGNPDTAPGTEKFDDVGDIRSALAALPSAEIVGAHDDGIPYLLRGQLGSAGSTQGFGALAAHERAAQALPSIAAAFRLQAADLVVKRVNVDEQGHTHIRYGQTKNGLPVVNEEIILHLDPQGTIYAANGSARDGETVSAKARISAESAVAAATRDTAGYRVAAEDSARLVYLRPTEGARLKLAYEVLVTGEGAQLPIRDLVYVSAADGSILARHSKIHSALNRAVYSANNGTTLPGTLKRSEGGAATGDAHVDQNYDRLGETYNCYKTLFNRDSYNNAGAQLKSTVHYSSRYVNAYWNSTQMVYGDGDGTTSIELGKDLDVTVHELTHAVTEYESNLTYSGESGGLNESMSDIFAGVCESWIRGWAVDADIFKIGEDIWTPATAGDALRYMDDPAKDGVSLDYYPNYSSGVDVHYSSGISNLVFALLSKGGTHPRGKTTVVVPAIGPEKAGRIFYKANTDLFTASTTFTQAKAYMQQATTALGYDAATLDAVTKAWEAVGVPPPPVPSNPLTNGVALTGLSGASGSAKYYYLDVPANRAVTFTLSGGTGDADMYVKFDSQPTTSSYDCRPYLSGNNETCNIAAKTTAGRYHVMLRGYSAYSGTSLKGQYTP